MPEKTQSFALKNNNASKDSSKKKGCCWWLYFLSCNQSLWLFSHSMHFWVIYRNMDKSISIKRLFIFKYYQRDTAAESQLLRWRGKEESMRELLLDSHLCCLFQQPSFPSFLSRDWVFSSCNCLGATWDEVCSLVPAVILLFLLTR